jgi:colicin import membrane protein
MARKLKIYQTSIGFYDLVIAAPSMKAALEAWGANSNLFHQGFAREIDDGDTVAAALEKPGVILKRPVGTGGPFTEHPDLPDDLPRGNAEKPPATHLKARPAKGVDDHAARKAALAFEQERQRRENERRKVEAAEARQRARRERAMDKAQAAIDAAERQHEELASAIDERRRALEAEAKDEDDRWTEQRSRLKAALERAKSSG